MSRRADSEDISSFDMLLDTMCNTFGGIVFIALLLSIISGSISREEAEAKVDEEVQVESVEKAIELARLQKQRDELQSAIQHLTNTFSMQSVDMGPTGAELPSLMSSNAELRSTISGLQASNRLLAQSIAETRASVSSNEAATVVLENEITRLRKQLELQRLQETRKVRMPRLHDVADMTPVFVAVRDGKLFAITDLSPQTDTWARRPYDSADVLVESGPGQDVVELRKNAGQPIVAGCERVGNVARSLQNIDSSSEFVSFLVHPNSFGQFNYLKQIFVDRGFSYNWHVSEGAITIQMVTEALQIQ